jgi:F-type H+-transporting ATPase subunit epsilon
MSTFHITLVSPEKLILERDVNQVDLPGAEGDLGVFAGHAPFIAMLRPGIVTVMIGERHESFVVLGGIAEFSHGNELTVLAESASPVEEFDLAGLAAKIEEMQEGLIHQTPGAELDRAIALLDHFKSIHINLAKATAF